MRRKGEGRRVLKKGGDMLEAVLEKVGRECGGGMSY